MFKKLITLALTVAIFTVPCTAFADTEETVRRSGVIPSSVDRSHLKDKHYRIGPKSKQKTSSTSKAKMAMAQTLAATASASADDAYYILPKLPGVRDQGSLGNCWAFSGMSAMEASILNNSEYSVDDIDLSEWHITYFSFNDESDELYAFSPADSSVAYYNHGGNYEMFTALLSRGTGAIYDAKAPTVSSGSNAYAVPSMPRDVALRNTYYIGRISTDSSANVDADKIAIVKQAIIDYGAVSANIYQYDSAYLNYSTYGYYTGSTDRTYYINHAVTIVGWDDSFSRTNFRSEVDQPTVDGAWIVLNSYGSSYGENGLYYVSYAETSLTEGYVVEAELVDKSKREKIYQHDPLGITGVNAVSNTTKIGLASIFTAEEDGTLVKVATHTNEAVDDNDQLLCDIKIYTGVSEGAPESGILMSTITEVDVSTPGYHTIELEDSVTLSEGDQFSVVATIYRNSGGNIRNVLPIMRKQNDASSIYRNAVIEEGNSFYKTDYSGNFDTATWYDEADDNEAVSLKAIVISDSNEDLLTITPESASIGVGETVQLSANLSGVTWSTDSSAVTVDANGVVTGVASGKAYIKAETDTQQNYAFISVSGGNSSVDDSTIVVYEYDTGGSGGSSGCNAGGYGVLSLLFALPLTGVGVMIIRNKKR